MNESKLLRTDKAQLKTITLRYPVQIKGAVKRLYFKFARLQPNNCRFNEDDSFHRHKIVAVEIAGRLRLPAGYSYQESFRW